MRLIRWLHISDIHMTARDSWSQDVVLSAMCDYIRRQRLEGKEVDFVLATGDLAFSGRPNEYALVGAFFDALSVASGVAKNRIFCIPGNHDVERDRQKLSFLGARASLRDENRIDLLLAGGEDLETLLKRQEAYRLFHQTYFTDQDRIWTDDGLCYLAHLTIEGVHLAVVGLNSVWLADGGKEDHGKLLIGERQVINAVRLVQESSKPPHIVVGMAHHPFHLLQDFDRRIVQNRIEDAFHFFHCGHLHEPETRGAGFGNSRCLVLAAGASFETRQSLNTFSVIALDLLRAIRNVEAIQYAPSRGAFTHVSSAVYPVEVTASGTCRVGELAQAIKSYRPSLVPWAHYLSALLLNQKAELLIPAQRGHTFGSLAVLQAQPDGDLKHKTEAFMGVRNILRVLYGRVPLSEVFARYGPAMEQYGAALAVLCKNEPSVEIRLAELERDAEVLASTEPRETFGHTSTLLADLAAAQEWDALREHARRHVSSPNQVIATLARRLLALSLAQSEEATDKTAAIHTYRELADEESPEATDVGNLAILLVEMGNFVEAEATLLKGIVRFSVDKADYFLEIGQRIVATTGDRTFRNEMEAAVAERRRHD